MTVVAVLAAAAVSVDSRIVGESPNWGYPLYAVAVALVGCLVALGALDWVLHESRVSRASAEIGFSSQQATSLEGSAFQPASALDDIPPRSLPWRCKLLTDDDDDPRIRTSGFGKVLAGSWRGRDVRLFEFRTEYSRSLLTEIVRDNDSPIADHYSCVVAHRSTGRSGASIESRSLREIYRNKPGDGAYTTTGWLDKLEAPLHDWLQGLQGSWGFRVDDPWVFCYITPRATTAEELRNLLDMLEGLIARLGQPPPPRRIWGRGEVD